MNLNKVETGNTSRVFTNCNTIDMAKNALVRSLTMFPNINKITLSDVKETSSCDVMWTDMNMNLQKPAETLKGTIPGKRIILECKGREYAVHTASDGRHIAITLQNYANLNAKIDQVVKQNLTEKPSTSATKAKETSITQKKWNLGRIIKVVGAIAFGVLLALDPQTTLNPYAALQRKHEFNNNVAICKTVLPEGSDCVQIIQDVWDKVAAGQTSEEANAAYAALQRKHMFDTSVAECKALLPDDDCVHLMQDIRDRAAAGQTQEEAMRDFQQLLELQPYKEAAKILKIPFGASQAEARAALRKLSQLYRTGTTITNEQITKLNEAFDKYKEYLNKNSGNK